MSFLVTGATHGLGLAVACHFAARRFPVLLVARNARSLGEVKSVLSAACPELETFAADSADEFAMQQAYETGQALGPVGGVLNNAGIIEPIARVSDLDIASWDLHMRTNLRGVLVGTQLALRNRSHDYPLRVVNVSSGAATRAFQGWGAYCASKAAVNMLTEVAAAENLDGNTSIVSVAPGVVETRMQKVIRKSSPKAFPDVGMFIDMKETGSLLHPIDAAKPLVWLLCGAPLSLSGRFVDGQDETIQRAVSETPILEQGDREARELFEAVLQR